jgi:hypothetical protein
MKQPDDKQMDLGVPMTTEGDLRRDTATTGAHRVSEGEAILRRNPMMRHLLGALDRGEDIGHYGRLVFAMVARHFLDEEELVGLLARGGSMGEQEAEALSRQVEERNYNPPRPERIAEWQRSQDFPICPEGDPRACNVYRDLRFPPGVYEQIRQFYEREETEEREDRRA